MTEAPTLGVGLMSGTSLDAMDAALVRFRGPDRAELLAFASRRYDTADRARLEGALAGGPPAGYAHLHAALGDWAAEAVEQVLAEAHLPASALRFICFPGQTLWHEPPLVTWQLGDPARLAERFGVAVVSDLRARDVAAGGQGAPLVPMADVLLFGATEAPRVLLNLGGIANYTYVRRRDDEAGAFATDTGPGMMVIDALARRVVPGLPHDVDGRVAAAGRVDEAALAALLADPWFTAPPPKSTGRERFGEAYATALHARVAGADGVATAVALTARSVAGALAGRVPADVEVLVSGGGVRHPGVMAALAEAVGRSVGAAARVRPFDEVFFRGDAKEAVAFALLGYLAMHGQPASLPAATGARGARRLGSITFP